MRRVFDDPESVKTYFPAKVLQPEGILQAYDEIYFFVRGLASSGLVAPVLRLSMKNFQDGHDKPFVYPKEGLPWEAERPRMYVTGGN